MSESKFPGAMGIAPRLLLFIVPFLLLAAAGSVFFPSAVDFEGKFRGFAFAAAIVISAFALVFYADLAVRLVVALRKKTLATGGTYSFCRHPLYAWYIFFVIPALTLFFDNWLFLLGSVAAYIAVKRYIGTEDAYLEAAFGEEFRRWRDSTRELVPVPRRKRPYPAAFARFALFCFAAGIYLVPVYFLAVRPVFRTFGATEEEVNASYPLDDLIDRPRFWFTQAVTIDAPPEEVWKWLVQVGYGRGGWYNFDGINGLIPDYFYEGGRSARRVIPELQAVKRGDKIGIAPGAELDVSHIDPGRSLVLTGFVNLDTGEGLPPDGTKPAHYMGLVWGYHLRDLGNGKTRFIARFRSDMAAGAAMLIGSEIVNNLGGGVLQQPAMSSGIKARAEGRI